LVVGLGDTVAIPNTLYRLYETRYGITVARAEERLRAVAATQEQAAHLGIDPGAPLLLIDRIAFAIDGRPVEHRASVCRTDRLHYLAELV
jgi:GntR family transcriptional regulator